MVDGPRLLRFDLSHSAIAERQSQDFPRSIHRIRQEPLGGSQSAFPTNRDRSRRGGNGILTRQGLRCERQRVPGP